jgi:serine/threonine protein kinase
LTFSSFADLIKKKSGLQADFAVLRPLGSGTFGKVWMVRYKGDNMVYAMKIMAKKSIYSENMSKHVRLEKEILATIGNHSPFVVGLRFAFQTPRTLCLVIEYLSGGSLFHHLRESEKPYSKEVARFYAVEILLALEALHTADFIYRDLKLENCLLDEEGMSLFLWLFFIFLSPFSDLSLLFFSSLLFALLFSFFSIGFFLAIQDTYA